MEIFNWELFKILDFSFEIWGFLFKFWKIGGVGVLDERWNFKQCYHRTADVSNLKIMERLNIERRKLVVTKMGNKNLETWDVSKEKYENLRNFEYLPIC